ncbi:TSUP family transporter [Halococcus sp. AFM35]|uniref:TSUP family transporter n=1 Tax=Halococcus sp. AFM35 TaxID=3421653 RepID=UPI003EBEC6B3
MDPGVLVVLALVSFVGGVVVTAVGPGGIFVLAALYVGTGLSAAQVAGTASATFVGGSALGALIYARSDDMDWSLAVAVGIGGVVGTRIGVALNALVSRRLFGILLGVLLAVTGLVIVCTERYGVEPTVHLDSNATRGLVGFAAIGLGVGVAGGLFGIGGAALVPPALVLVGVGLVPALAATQVAVVFISAATMASYFVQGAIVAPLVFVVGGSYLVGAVGGWRVAHRVDADRLTVVLGLTLLGLAPLLVVRALLM